MLTKVSEINTLSPFTSSKKGSCLKCKTETIHKAVTICDKCNEADLADSKNQKHNYYKDKLVYSSRILRRMSHSSLETITPTNTQKLLHKYLLKAVGSTNSKLPYIFGPPGRGKSLLGFASGISFIDKHLYEVLVISAPSFMIRLNSLDGISKKLFSYKMIIIDDIGNHNTNQFSLNMLYTVISYASTYKVPLLITSNYSLKELSSKLKSDNAKIQRMTCDSIQDRIMAMCIPFNLKGPNIRFTNSQNTQTLT